MDKKEFLISVEEKEQKHPVSINELRDRELSGEKLSKTERQALINYDKHRLEYLNEAKNEKDFQKRYLKLQVQANLCSYSDFV